MAFSYVERTGDGTTTAFTFAFTGQDQGYISADDILALVDGVDTPFTLTSSNTLEFSVAPVNGAEIIIRRVMPKGLPYADFRTGNNFGQSVLNNSFLQSLYIIHEALDGWFPDNFQFLTNVGFAGDVNLNGFDLNSAGTITADDIVIGPLGLSSEGILTESYNWAQYPVDQLVPEGNGIDEYSSFHHATKAEGSAGAAFVSETNAASSESSASTSASNAATSEANALSSANAAATSASNASTSESNALDSADSADTSAFLAANSASEASTSETNAAASASSASASASSAMTSADNAAISESNAGTSATTSSNWAIYPEDQLVPEGNGVDEYSSLHYAKKAEESAADASTTLSSAVQVQSGSFTIRVPGDFATIEGAVNEALRTRIFTPFRILILLQTGFEITERTRIFRADLSNIDLESENATVLVNASMPSDDLFQLFNCVGLNFGLKIDAQGFGDNGIYLDNSKIELMSGAGVDNAGSFGLYADKCSSVRGNTNNSFQNAGQTNAVDGTGVSARRGSSIYLEGCNTSGSAVYGLSASDGSVVVCKNITSNNCGRHGVRADESSSISANNITAQNANNFGLYALRASTITAQNGDLSGAGERGIYAAQGSRIDCRNSLANNCNQGIVAIENSHINATSCTADNNVQEGIRSDHGSTINFLSGNATGNATDISVSDGGICNVNSATYTTTSKNINTISGAGIIFG